MSDLRRALQWIAENAEDEGVMGEYAYCDHPWHTDKAHETHPLTESISQCPCCCSSWWATDGSEPGEPAVYALQAAARRALRDL